MTDAELEAQLDEMGATEQQRVVARRILARQREAERQTFADAHLPQYMRYTAHAEDEGVRLQAAGEDVDAVERRLFDGLPRDGRCTAPHRKLLSLRRGRRPVGVGTWLLVAAAKEAVGRGRKAGHEAATRKVREADAFGRNFTKDMLSAAGWPQEDLDVEPS